MAPILAFDDPDNFEIKDTSKGGPYDRVELVETHSDGSTSSLSFPKEAVPKLIAQLAETLDGSEK